MDEAWNPRNGKEYVRKIHGLAHKAFCRDTKIVGAQETHQKRLNHAVPLKWHPTGWLQDSWRGRDSCTFKVELIVAVINSFL